MWGASWVLPNVELRIPLECSYAALVPTNDVRVRALVRRHPNVGKFLRRFTDGFGERVRPSVLLHRENAPPSVLTVGALTGFRDAISISVLSVSHANALLHGRSYGANFSDVFDIHPWGLSNTYDEHLISSTPSILATHDLKKFHGQSTGGLSRSVISFGDFDATLLSALVARWDALFAGAPNRVEDVALFRSLNMANYASRMPGRADATFLDAGRAVALWVSAFEILAHNAGSGLGHVLKLFADIKWERKELSEIDRVFKKQKKRVYETNLAGELYERLHHVRNQFLHGNPVTPDTLTLSRCGRSLLNFAAPLYRLALTAALGLSLESDPPSVDDAEAFSTYLCEHMSFYEPQKHVEDALLMARGDHSTEGELPVRLPYVRRRSILSE